MRWEGRRMEVAHVFVLFLFTNLMTNGKGLLLWHEKAGKRRIIDT
jgi:hypothetical protein